MPGADPRPTAAGASRWVTGVPGSWTHPDPGGVCPRKTRTHHSYETATTCELASSTLAWRLRQPGAAPDPAALRMAGPAALRYVLDGSGGSVGACLAALTFGQLTELTTACRNLTVLAETEAEGRLTSI